MPIWLIVVISVAAVVLITLLVCAIRFVKNNSSQTSEAEKALQKEI
jgi:heme/copper-type cytochrome/quinol oxidase subunit 2